MMVECQRLPAKWRHGGRHGRVDSGIRGLARAGTGGGEAFVPWNSEAALFVAAVEAGAGGAQVDGEGAWPYLIFRS
jgi:hypothetical protein